MTLSLYMKARDLMVDIRKTTAVMVAMIIILTTSGHSSEPTCDEVLGACDEALVSEQAAHSICREINKHRFEKIENDKREIERLSSMANHSHIPIITYTSAFWILLLILL